ncbi:hypothetical protein TrST_g4372 [Triparma strigata]|uniref:Uncharacterized protein n=1 Tax=Triparma strigata TaxID=1606541 RepID=A0A9W7AFV7_9STRA|nr:hypothetical protein TrST_g4372 [Triparma strigata]
MSAMFRIPRIFGSMKVPIFGTLDQALNFAAHNGAALPRYAKWGLSIPIAAGWFIWPALTQDFKAGIGIGITVEEEQEIAKAKEAALASPTGKAHVDYSATGALQTFSTRGGVKNKFIVDDEDDIDQVPVNTDEEAVAAILAAQEEASKSEIKGAESVDALRRFATRKDAKYEWNFEDIDTVGTAGGGEDEDEEDDDE